MEIKPVEWWGTSRLDLCNEKIFTPRARREAGFELAKVQEGSDPSDWKPFESIGPGTKEIRIADKDGSYRVLYVAKFPEAVYVLHCFRKKTPTTPKHDKDLAQSRYQEIVNKRRKGI